MRLAIAGHYNQFRNWRNSPDRFDVKYVADQSGLFGYHEDTEVLLIGTWNENHNSVELATLAKQMGMNVHQD